MKITVAGIGYTGKPFKLEYEGHCDARLIGHVLNQLAELGTKYSEPGKMLSCTTTYDDGTSVAILVETK